MSKECDGKMLFNIKSLMLTLDSITEFGDECYAHLSEDGNQKETLIEHTERCQKYWFNIVEAKHIETVFIKFEQLYLGDITNEAIHIFELMSVNVVTIHHSYASFPELSFCLFLPVNPSKKYSKLFISL